jgi:hypothetical protein
MLEHLAQSRCCLPLGKGRGRRDHRRQHVTYDLKADRNPTAVGTREMAEAICKEL